MAWGRIILFGGAAALCHKHNKTAAYVLVGIAGVCAVTSISTGAYAATVNPPTARSNVFVSQQPQNNGGTDPNVNTNTDNTQATDGGYAAGGASGSW
jgi:NAD/NADP transhydrogenase alpha subunit